VSYDNKTEAGLREMADGFERDGIDRDAGMVRAALEEIERLRGERAGYAALVADLWRKANAEIATAIESMRNGLLSGSPAPSARGAGARWIANDSGWGWKCSKCGARIGANEASEHEASCWPSPAVSARQDAPAAEEKPREGGDPVVNAWADVHAATDAYRESATQGFNARGAIRDRLIASIERLVYVHVEEARRAPSSLRGEPVDDLVEALDAASPTALEQWSATLSVMDSRVARALKALFDAARARALKMSSEPRGAQEADHV
jgi:hypothetical protein